MPSELVQSSSDPLYKQVMDDIVRDIDSGFYGAGERIPSEEDLRDIYKVSRVTIRRSLSELTKRGYLVKQQGKGTLCRRRHREKLFSEMSTASIVLPARAGRTVASLELSPLSASSWKFRMRRLIFSVKRRGRSPFESHVCALLTGLLSCTRTICFKWIAFLFSLRWI